MEKNFAKLYPEDATFDLQSRIVKAKKVVAVIKDYKKNLSELNCLDYGCSIGLMTNYFASLFKEVIGIDIDKKAITKAQIRNNKSNLKFKFITNGELPYPNNCFDVVIFNQVYEHTEYPESAMREILRVLKPGGVCYFGARNKYFPLDGHYLIPFMAYFPKGISNLIMKYILNKKYYDIKLYSLEDLKKLTRNFRVIDYTLEIFKNPAKFYLDKYLRFLLPFAKIFYFLIPNYVWLLKKA